MQVRNFRLKIILLPIFLLFATGCHASIKQKDSNQFSIGDSQNPHNLECNITKGCDLKTLLRNALSPSIITLSPGTYDIEATEIVDSHCGNCQEHATSNKSTVGLIIKNKKLILRGHPTPNKVTIKTNAGFGIYIQGSEVTLENITISGGVRSEDENASDGAIVVRNSKVTLQNLQITNNNTRVENITQGVAGIIGREGADMLIQNNSIINNSWDGITLYRGAKATIKNNLIRQGRGVGVATTWDSEAIVDGNKVSNYWKGIGAFGNSKMNMKRNEIKQMSAWGIASWGAGIRISAIDNVISNSGRCGALLHSAKELNFQGNQFVKNGRNEETHCPKAGVVWYRNLNRKNHNYWPENWAFEKNIFSDNYFDFGHIRNSKDLPIDPSDGFTSSFTSNKIQNSK
ncbi:MAG: right-handed parallel beta-helix repeat-containing protein [Oligoflexales bacterium]|nr:right-handed parallel beta-helix repeat-containing protein [Oligoflexales bacterium]